MHKTHLITAAIFGVLAIAFGAHSLEKITTDARPDDPFGREKIIHGFHTGV